jgi:hypothetical protein
MAQFAVNGIVRREEAQDRGACRSCESCLMVELVGRDAIAVKSGQPVEQRTMMVPGRWWVAMRGLLQPKRSRAVG